MENLRRQAEEKLKFVEKSHTLHGFGQTDLIELTHELAVHQIELEIQNEDLKQTQQELLTARDRYAELYDFAPTGYFTLSDESSRIVEVNLTGCQMLKEERTHLLKKRFAIYLDPQDADSFYFCRKKAQESSSRQTCDLKMLKADGTSFFARLEMISPVTGELRVAVLDVTESKKAEEALQKYTRDLEVANKELEAFSYSVSHDLRQPLRALDGFSEAILLDYGERLDETGKDYLIRIRRASQRMSQLVDDMLKLSRISRADMVPESINLTELIKNFTDDLRSFQPERQVEFIIAPKMMVIGDRQLLRILIGNLLENAWKFTSKRPLAKIEAGFTQLNGETTYFIKDNGTGFDMAYADKLFQPFQRLHSNIDYPGTGIGLAIVQRIVRRHGGRIWAESSPDQGATFYFTLG